MNPILDMIYQREQFELFAIYIQCKDKKYEIYTTTDNKIPETLF